VITIPERPATVNVSGEVRFPVNTLFEPNRGYKHYLEKVGGTTEDADRRRITVRLPNGRNMKPKSFWGLVQRDIPAGSSIIVPKKKEGTKIKWSEVIQSTTAILTTTVVIVVGIEQLQH
jgi:protein involved in polysaccharide export with SLBB domain